MTIKQRSKKIKGGKRIIRSITMHPHLLAALNDEAARQGCSVSCLLEQIVELWCEAQA